MQQTNFDGPENIHLQPNIGLDASVRQSVVEILNLLLADEAVLSQKTKHADGHTGVLNIPELQPLYDDQYQQISNITKEILERIQILSGSRRGAVDVSIKQARLNGETNANPGIVNILANHEAFIRFLREDARKCSELYEDLGTYALLVNILRSHEKMAWILRSNIALKQFNEE